MKRIGLKGGRGRTLATGSALTDAGILPALLVFFLASAGCSGEGSSGQVILTVNGCPVTEGEFYEAYDYALLHRPVLDGPKSPVEALEDRAPGAVDEDALKKKIFADQLIPFAVVKARYKDRIPELMRRGKEILKEIEPGGANFAKVAAAHSQDTNAEGGGALGVITRVGLPYPLPQKAFQASSGEIVGPFISLVGCHVLFVQDKMQGVVPSSDRIRASHILLAFEPERKDFLVKLLPEWVKAAKIEVTDPSYGRYLEARSGSGDPGDTGGE